MVRPAHRPLATDSTWRRNLHSLATDDDDKKLLEQRLGKASTNFKESAHFSWLLNKIATVFRSSDEATTTPIVDRIYCFALGSPTGSKDSAYQLALVRCLEKKTGCKNVWVVEPNLTSSDEEWLHNHNISTFKPDVVLESLNGCADVERSALDSVKFLQDQLTDVQSRENIFIFAPHCPLLITLGLGLTSIKTASAKFLLYVNDMTLYLDRVALAPNSTDAAAARSVVQLLTDQLQSFLSPSYNKDDELYSAFQSLALYYASETTSSSEEQ